MKEVQIFLKSDTPQVVVDAVRIDLDKATTCYQFTVQATDDAHEDSVFVNGERVTRGMLVSLVETILDSVRKATNVIVEPFDPRIYDLILDGPYADRILPRFTGDCLRYQTEIYEAWLHDQKERRQHGL